MKAFVLAAGEGTRMRPLTANIPKPLLPVAGRPFLGHTLKALKDEGIMDVILLTGWKAKRLREHFGDGSQMGISISYVEQERRLGTAHAIGMGRDLIRDRFICIYGDVVLTGKMLRALLSFASGRKGTVMSLVRTKHPEDYGVCMVEGDRLAEIEEKPARPKGNLINAGIYVFDPDIFEAIAGTEKSPRGEYEVTTSIEMLMKKGEVYAHVIQEDWITVTNSWDLLGANEILMKDMKGSIESDDIDKNAVIKGEVRIEKGTSVKAGAYIRGPVIIGKDSDIGPNCYIRPSTYIGCGCKVGNASEVKNSIIMSGTKIPHLNYIGDSIIGERCNLGAGTKVANVRLDEGEISVTFEGRDIPTGRKKLGVIMGDDVKTGINASIDVGTIIGEGTFIGPNATARGFISPGSRMH